MSINLDMQSQAGLNAFVGVMLQYHGAQMPPETTARIHNANMELSLVDRFRLIVEALYTTADELPVEVQMFGASLATFIDQNWGMLVKPDGVGDPNRARKIARAFRRLAGQLTEEQAPSFEDPTPFPRAT